MSVAGDTSNNEELTENGDSDDTEESDDNSDIDSQDMDDDDDDDEDDDDDNDVDGDEIESVQEIFIEVMDSEMQTEDVKVKEIVEVKNRSAQTEKKENIEADALRVKVATGLVKEIDCNLANMVVDSLIPLNLVQQDAFKAFCKSLEAKYHLPKVKKLAGEINRRYEEARNVLENEIKETVSVAVTFNSWSTSDERHYCDVMAKFVTNQWNQMSVMLGTCEIDKSRVESITHSLKNIIRDWKLPSTVLVTGLGKPELASVESLRVESVACLGHFIRHLVKDCLNHKNVSDLVEKGRNLIDALHSLSNSRTLRKSQRADLRAMLEFHKLYADEPSKWSTTVDMLSSLADQAETIQDVVKDLNVDDNKISDSLYSDDEANFIKYLVTILSQFKTAVEILTASDTTTAEKRLPTLIKLQKSLAEDEDDLASVLSLKNEIRKRINSLILHNKESLLVSCIVHPQTKQLMFVSPEEMSHAKLLLFDKMTEIIRKNEGGSEKVESKKVDDEMSDGGSKPVTQDRTENVMKDSLKSERNESVDTSVDNDDGKLSEMKGCGGSDKSLAKDSELKTEASKESVDRDAGLAIGESKADAVSDNQAVAAKNGNQETVEDTSANVQAESEKVSEGSESFKSQPNQNGLENLEKKEIVDSEIDSYENNDTDSNENTVNKADNCSVDKPDKDSTKSADDSKNKQYESSNDEGIKEDSDKSANNEKPMTDSERTDLKAKLPSKSDKKSKVDTADWLEDVIGSGKSHKVTPEQKAKVELDLYLAEPAIKTDALDWWKKKQSVFPTVSQVARCFLPIPASGMSLEDVMNLNDDKVDAKRSLIDPNHLDAMLFLNKNKGMLLNKNEGTLNTKEKS